MSRSKAIDHKKQPRKGNVSAITSQPTKDELIRANIESTIKKCTPGILAVVAIFVVVFFMIQFPSSETKVEAVKFATTTSLVRDSNIELGDSRVSQKGVEGIAKITYSHSGTLFDFIFRKDNIKKEKISSEVTKKPKDEVVTMGGKKYQYMYCSNGSYRYYTDDQFKSIDTGFTHKSEDYCSKNNQGTMTYLADAPPGTNNAVKVYISPALTSYKPTNNTTSPAPTINPPVYTGPVQTGNPEVRQLCENNYNSAMARLGSPPTSWNYGDSSVTEYYNSLNHIQSVYNSCLRAAGY